MTGRYFSDWRHHAACRDEDPELFFPVTDQGPGAMQTARAKAICHRCPVRAECLQFAIDDGLDYGIFGGLTGTERRILVRRQGRSHAA